jgi:hypothetical protein
MEEVFTRLVLLVLRGVIEEITKKRLKSALKFFQRTGVRLVYAQISPPWVQDIGRWVCNKLPPDVSVVLINRHSFGKLPTVEWGRTTST